MTPRCVGGSLHFWAKTYAQILCEGRSDVWSEPAAFRAGNQAQILGRFSCPVSGGPSLRGILGGRSCPFFSRRSGWWFFSHGDSSCVFWVSRRFLGTKSCPFSGREILPIFWARNPAQFLGAKTSPLFFRFLMFFSSSGKSPAQFLGAKTCPFSGRDDPAFERSRARAMLPFRQSTVLF